MTIEPIEDNWRLEEESRRRDEPKVKLLRARSDVARYQAELTELEQALKREDGSSICSGTLQRTCAGGRRA